MKLILLLLLLTISNLLFAQKTNSKYSITIFSIGPFANSERYYFTIVKNKNQVSFKYSLFDSLQLRLLRKDTVFRRLDREVADYYKDTSKKHDERINDLSKIIDKYNVYDNDSLSFNLTAYPNYRKLLDSVYSGTDFKDTGPRVLDGVSYSIKIKSQTVSRDFGSTEPNENSNPIIYHLIHDTFIIYRKLSKNPLVYHKHIYHKT
ncbi:hypothetical protein [Mucilaginibacter sp.]